MNKHLLLLLLLLPAGMFAQQQVTFPDDFLPDALNGKEVTITNTLTLTNNYNYYTGDITLSNGMLWIPTEKNLPDKAMFAEKNAENKANQLTVYNGKFSFVDADGTCRIGQTVTGITGTVKYSNGKYTLTLTQEPQFTGNPRPTEITTEEAYNVKVASFNIEHFNAKEEVQRTKVSLSLKALNADIYALTEVQGNGALHVLCDSLNKFFPDNTYLCVDNTSNTTSDMCAFIYNAAKMDVYGSFQRNKLALWNGNPYLDYRKVAQAFTLRSNNERFIVCLNHWKAKDGDGDTQDGQSGSVAKRMIEAEATLRFIEEMKTTFDDPDVLIVGDLNSYTKEDPIRTLDEGGMFNQLQKYAPTEYSYAYHDNSLGYYAVGYLDHSFANSSMDAQIVDARPFRINADEPQKLDIGQPNVQPDNMYRCSDHNPIVTFINLPDNSTGIHSPTATEATVRLSGNPHDGYLNIESHEPLTRIEVMQTNGQPVAAYRASNRTFTLPVEGLPGGIYLIRIRNDKGEQTTLKTVLP
ncbi:MAG: T9SS type A sorting domain-containing protein [Prevotellaceae bacterium]|jgi:predicted extracellular nuclease|nr:T9SS type A sorting domain-containing protein [Prevotellaceae bacterium]